MKKLAWGVVIWIVIGALVALWFLKAPILSFYLSYKMQVEVFLNGFDVSKSGISITGFKMRNPEGFKTQTAFRANTIDMNYDWHSLRANPSVINSILIDRVFLSIELTNLLGTQNNWTAIIQKMPKNEDRADGHEVIVRNLTLTNVVIEIRGMQLLGAPKVIHLPKLEFTNLSSAEGFPTKQAISQIFQKAGLQKYIQDILSPQGLLKKMLPLSENEPID